MELSEIKQQLSILEVLRHYNLSVDKNNRLKCPFHDDKTPSMQVYPKTGTWTCFSRTCSAGSDDQVDFIMKYEKTSNHEMIMKARDLPGYHLNPPPSEIKSMKFYNYRLSIAVYLLPFD